MKLPFKAGKVLTFIFPVVFFAACTLIFAFRLTKIPPGINIDESSIGYNASLIADTLHDENGRFLPVFILTIDNKDWKQPVRIYTTALIFKIFGKSLFALRSVSIFFIIVSGVIFYKILRIFFTKKLSYLGVALYFMSPSVFLQSHLALENVDMLPFFLLWLYFLFLFFKKQDKKAVFFSGFFLGLSFYAYKGMHALIFVYLLVSVVGLIFRFLKSNYLVKYTIIFLLGLAPFLIPLKWLQVRYAGAIYDPSVISLPSFFDSAYVFLSSFDLSFLFLKGDRMLIHSTGRYGMFLLPCIILFLLGFLEAVEEKKLEFYIVFFSLMLTPLPLITVNSVYRASRLMVYVPLATIIFLLGFKKILKNKLLAKPVCLVMAVLIIWNWLGFVKYYYSDYPKTISADFSPNFDSAMRGILSRSLLDNKMPYVENSLFLQHKEDVSFFSRVYFSKRNIKIWKREEEDFPKDGYVLTDIAGSKKIKNILEVPSLQSGQKTLYIVGFQE